MKNRRIRLTESQVRLIIKDHHNGVRQNVTAKKVGVSGSYVSTIVNAYLGKEHYIKIVGRGVLEVINRIKEMKMRVEILPTGSKMVLESSEKLETGIKQIKISGLVPQGYEIDKEKSTFENIILKPIEVKLPLSVDDLPKGTCFNQYDSKLNAFRDLLLLRDAWNGDWRPDWEDMLQIKYCIEFVKNKVSVENYQITHNILNFKTRELAEKFAEEFADLINEAKELL